MSCSSSWPSRLRSPTPAKTERPWYFSAITWISSITGTVLPTPAPPNMMARLPGFIASDMRPIERDILSK